MTRKGEGGNNNENLAMKRKGEEGVKKLMSSNLHNWESCCHNYFHVKYCLQESKKEDLLWRVRW